MSFPLPSIEVVVEHSLPKATAWERLKSLKPTDSAFTLGDHSWDADTWTLKFEGKYSTGLSEIPIYGTLRIADEYVKLTTDPLPLLVTPFVWWVERTIKKHLAEALK